MRTTGKSTERERESKKGANTRSCHIDRSGNDTRGNSLLPPLSYDPLLVLCI